MFPGNKRELGEWKCEDSRQSSSLQLLSFKHMRGVNPSDLSMSMKNSLQDWDASHSLTAAVDPWTVILLPVLCETIRAIGPLVLWEHFFFLRSIVCCEKRQKDSYNHWQPQRRITVTKDGTKSSIHSGGWKQQHKHTKEKSNGTLQIQVQHSPYSFFLNPLLSGCKLFWDLFFFPF